MSLGRDRFIRDDDDYPFGSSSLQWKERAELAGLSNKICELCWAALIEPREDSDEVPVLRMSMRALAIG